ncbi:hypothetical protein DIPPA_25818 [Diplonema papillatum]|nr:hypothetical protein DIPPA_25818 [Diplonema papillatum]|eukprot:gene10377-15981_t
MGALFSLLRFAASLGSKAAATVLLVAYIVSPVDLIPDIVPLVGAVDDIGLFVLWLQTVLNIDVFSIAKNIVGRLLFGAVVLLLLWYFKSLLADASRMETSPNEI